MADDWTPGAGASTLEWVAGMLSLRGYSCLSASEHRVRFVREDGYGGVTAVDAGRATLTAEDTPDLNDRATFLLALDQLAERVGLDPAGGVWWSKDDPNAWPGYIPPRTWWRIGNETALLTFGMPWVAAKLPRHPDYLIGDTDDPAEALDRALYATMEVPDGE